LLNFAKNKFIMPKTIIPDKNRLDPGGFPEGFHHSPGFVFADSAPVPKRGKNYGVYVDKVR